MIVRLLILAFLIATPTVVFSPKRINSGDPRIKQLVADLHKHQWRGAKNVMSPTHWEFYFTEPMEEILKIGHPAQAELLPYLEDESIKDQIIILLGGLGDEQSVSWIIESMISEEDIKNTPRAKQINLAANLALTNITVADVIWHHGGGVVIENCPDNPKECWAEWWEKNESTFLVTNITQSRDYANYPNYGIYENKQRYLQ